MSFHVFVATHAKIEFYVKLDMMPMQTNVKMTAARKNYRVSRKLMFNWHEHFREGRESQKDDSHYGWLVNVWWHDLVNL